MPPDIGVEFLFFKLLKDELRCAGSLPLTQPLPRDPGFADKIFRSPGNQLGFGVLAILLLLFSSPFLESLTNSRKQSLPYFRWIRLPGIAFRGRFFLGTFFRKSLIDF